MKPTNAVSAGINKMFERNVPANHPTCGTDSPLIFIGLILMSKKFNDLGDARSTPSNA